MRVDKFLKVSRIIKRRTVAKDVANSSRILVNERSAKAGHELKVGDTITVTFGRRQLKVEVLILKDTMPANDADTMYKVLEDIKIPD